MGDFWTILVRCIVSRGLLLDNSRIHHFVGVGELLAGRFEALKLLYQNIRNLEELVVLPCDRRQTRATADGLEQLR